ncbi:reverse transcriptase domain-containing protein [Tanacetum coccineum]|uniref:Reverse transcriptase domain-containing protein n=1 Tax=Tanacetum coccineum TaxID=301880 RepID=A0ABQ5BPK4_9ASTR
METVFRISNCIVENQVKFSTCTLMGTALTWWNLHARTVTNEVAYAMTWSDLKKKMTTKYCRGMKSKKVEAELWEPKSTEGSDVVTYNMIPGASIVGDRMFLEEDRQLKGMSVGCPDQMLLSVWHRSKRTTAGVLLRWATELMDRRINTSLLETGGKQEEV